MGSLGVPFDLGFRASLLPESALPWPAASSSVLLPVSVFSRPGGQRGRGAAALTRSSPPPAVRGLEPSPAAARLGLQSLALGSQRGWPPGCPGRSWGPGCERAGWRLARHTAPRTLVK